MGGDGGVYQIATEPPEPRQGAIRIACAPLPQSRLARKPVRNLRPRYFSRGRGARTAGRRSASGEWTRSQLASGTAAPAQPTPSAEDRFLAFTARSQGDREGAPGVDLAGSARRLETTGICAQQTARVDVKRTSQIAIVEVEVEERGRSQKRDPAVLAPIRTARLWKAGAGQTPIGPVGNGIGLCDREGGRVEGECRRCDPHTTLLAGQPWRTAYR
jgi:hypothetical protein